MVKSSAGVFEIAPSLFCLSAAPSFVLPPPFVPLFHRRAGAFGLAKEEFWQGSLWEDRYRKGDASLNQSLHLFLSPSSFFFFFTFLTLPGL